MMISCCLFCLFQVLINKVSLQVPSEAVIGGSVVLPCSSTEHDLKLQDINVFWRHNGSKIVYDIVKGKDSLEKQDQQYKSRAETFPDEYLRGHFSLKLNNLTHTDAGKYSCLIAHSFERKTIQLIINESTAEKETISTGQEKQGETEPGNVWTLSPLLLVCIVLTVLFFIGIFSVGLIVYKKKKSSCIHRAGGNGVVSDAQEVTLFESVIAENNDKAIPPSLGV